MRKKVVLLLMVVGLTTVFFSLKNIVSVTGSVIWIDRSNEGSWQHSKGARGWWGELASKNPSLDNKAKWVVVYLVPDLQMSQTAFGRKDQPPTLFADWRVWGKVDVLTISVNWEEWEMIELGDRQKQLANFVAVQIAEHWRVTHKQIATMTDMVLRGEVEPPVQLRYAGEGER